MVAACDCGRDTHAFSLRVQCKRRVSIDGEQCGQKAGLVYSKEILVLGRVSMRVFAMAIDRSAFDFPSVN